ncbi:MAG: HD domain-containing protein [Oligoflexia bacterium]|nr:HD domain-containing protein [Oligoflexia bacterium]
MNKNYNEQQLINLDDFELIEITKLSEFKTYPCDLYIPLSKRKLLKLFLKEDVVDTIRLENYIKKGIKSFYAKKTEIDQKLTAVNKTESEDIPVISEINYLPIRTSTLIPDQNITFNIFAMNDDGSYPILIEANSIVNQEQISCLLAENLRQVFILDHDEKSYQEYIDSNLKQIIEKVDMKVEEKAEVVSDHVCNKLESMMTDTSEESIKTLNVAQEHLQDFLKSSDDAVGSIIKMLTNDHQTVYNHSLTVGSLAYATALEITKMRQNPETASKVKMFDEYTLDSDEIRNILFSGALLHDIGKLIICLNHGLMTEDNKLPDEIPAELLSEHPKAGHEHLKKFKSVHPKSLEIVIQHEEFCDGSGYPNHLPKSQISIYTQIISLANYYDNLVSSKKNPLNSERALQEMDKVISKFNKYILPIFKTVVTNINASNAN